MSRFFALSGFLVTGSLGRTRLHQFVTLRVIRLIPALAVEITLSAVIIGLIFTTLPASEYLTSKGFYAYFLNIVGDIQVLVGDIQVLVGDIRILTGLADRAVGRFGMNSLKGKTLYDIEKYPIDENGKGYL